MNKQEMKKVINQEFGFATNKIVLLEGSERNGKFDYIMFAVCNIEYQMIYSFYEQRYILNVYRSNGAISFGA